MLSKDTEVHRQAHLQATEAFQTFEEFYHHIQTQLQHQAQEIKGLIAVKDHRIKKLNNQVKQMETKLKNTEEDNINKYANVLLALKEWDAKLEAQCHSHTELMQKAKKRIDKLQENMKVLVGQVRWSQKDHEKAMKEKNEIIQRLLKEVETTQAGWDKYISHISNEMVVKKTEMIDLQDRELKLRAELDRSKEEMERYKQQLCAGLEKERNSQQLKVQVDLEWQRHCEDMKAEFYLANEKLIQELTQTRDQGFIPREELLASEEICRLKEQNNALRAAVTQMRKDMECLNHPLFHSQAQPQATYPQILQHTGSPAATSITPTVNNQMATRPPPHCTDLSSKVILSDRQNENSVANTESGPCNITEKVLKNPLAEHLPEKNMDLQQPQASGLFENVQGGRGNPPLLHTRLKKAASCIARLSSEKQLLIEMGNHLRSQITTARLQGNSKARREPAMSGAEVLKSR